MPSPSGSIQRDEAFNDIFGARRVSNRNQLVSYDQQAPLDASSIPALPQPQHQPQHQHHTQQHPHTGASPQHHQAQIQHQQRAQQGQQQRIMNVPPHLQQYNYHSSSQEHLPRSPIKSTLDPAKMGHSDESRAQPSPVRQQFALQNPQGPSYAQPQQQHSHLNGTAPSPQPPIQQYPQRQQHRPQHVYKQGPIPGAASSSSPGPQTQHAQPAYPQQQQYSQHQYHPHHPQQQQQHSNQHHIPQQKPAPIQHYRAPPPQQQPHQSQYPSSANQHSYGQRSGSQQGLPPLKVNLNSVPEAVPERFRNSPTFAQNSQFQPQQQQQHPQQQQLTQSQRSPILRQGLGFFNRAGNSAPRSVSTSAVHSELNSAQGTGINGAPRTMSLSATSHDKYHQQNVKPTTLSGRIIPQKVDMGYQNGNGNNGGVMAVTNGSANSSPILGSKSRSFSSLAKGSLSKRRSTSSANLKNIDRSVSNSSIASKAIVTASKRPSIYPALLSRVAKLFQERIVLGSRLKNGLEYRDAFTGSEAVDIIAHIIRTSDRNLALLLGRALDAQRFFHDVTYEHRLRDTTNEVYQFNTITTFYEDPTTIESRHNSVSSDTVNSPTLQQAPQFFGAQQQAQQIQAQLPLQQATPLQLQQAAQQQQQQQQTIPVNGVFTLLTECYSPTCTKDRLCYSIACPRRLEQQARLNLKPQGGLQNDNHLSLLQEPDESKHLWSFTVSKEVLESVDKKEAKRQETIFETIYTERDFVKDLEYIRDFWIRPLRESNIIPEREREKFIRTVFNGITEILAVNAKFAEALTRRQNSKPIVDQITDIFLQYIPHFEPFVHYGAGQVFGKYEYERQKTTNPLFSRFIEETERLKESRRLDVSSFLSKPTTRMPKYILLLRTIKHNSKPDSPDYENLDKAISLLEKVLSRINEETGKAADRHELIVLKQKLQFRPGEFVDLKLGSPNRKLLFKATLKKRNQDKDNQGEVYVYLFDHSLVFVRIKLVNKREQHKVYQRPIPLPLLFISLNEDGTSLRALTRKSTSTSLVTTSTSTLVHNNSISSNINMTKFPLTFLYVGRKGYDLTLYASNYSTQKTLLEKIEEQHKKLIEQNDIFTLIPLTQKFFDSTNKINCVVPFDGGRRLLYGTDSGIYISNIRRSDNGARVVSAPVKVINKVNIIQLEVLEEYQTFLVLTDKKLMSWSLDILQQSPPDSNKNAKLGKELMTHVSFFRVGICSGRMLVCAAKNGSHHLIRVFEPIDPIQQKKLNKKKFKNETKELTFSSEPVSISFLKTKLCVGCTKGFEIVSMETNSMESLLDPADTSLDFVTNKEGLKPLEIDRINSDFLLSYSDFSFYVNRNGWRSRSNFLITWEGLPQAFAIWYPYLLAFDTNFIEIRHVETGELIRIINGENIRLLHSSSQEILYAYEDERGYDVVASLDFWDKSTGAKTVS